MRTISNLEAQKLLPIAPSQVGCIGIRILEWTSFMKKLERRTYVMPAQLLQRRYHVVVVVVLVV